MKNLNLKCNFILLTLIAPLSATSAELTSNERYTKGLIQFSSAFNVKRALDEDINCKHKRFRTFSIDEVISTLPKSEFKDEAEITKLKETLPELIKKAQEARLPDGKMVYQQSYEIMLAAYRQAGVILTGRDGHCEVLYQAANNMLENAKNNFRLIDK